MNPSQDCFELRMEISRSTKSGGESTMRRENRNPDPLGNETALALHWGQLPRWNKAALGSAAQGSLHKIANCEAWGDWGEGQVCGSCSCLGN